MLFALLIGALCGLRSLAPLAVVAWAAHVGGLTLPVGLAWIGGTGAAIVLAALAAGELVVDKLPTTPSRTAPPALVARMVTGAATAACVAGAGGTGVAAGAVIGIVGALLGTFGGHRARTGLVQALGAPDVAIALLEDFVTIGGAVFVASHA